MYTMVKKVKVVNVNDDTTYNDITEAVVENESEQVEESMPVEESTPVEEMEPEPPKPKARAKRVSKPKVLERTDTEIEPETPPPICRSKTQSKTGCKS